MNWGNLFNVKRIKITKEDVVIELKVVVLLTIIQESGTVLNFLLLVSFNIGLV